MLKLIFMMVVSNLLMIALLLKSDSSLPESLYNYDPSYVPTLNLILNLIINPPSLKVQLLSTSIYLLSFTDILTAVVFFSKFTVKMK